MSDQNAPYLKAASSRIADVILDYCSRRMGGTFRADDLRRYVDASVDGGCAPASADRVLRDLRQKGAVNYTVLNRAQSLYQVGQAKKDPRQRDLFEPLSPEHPAR